ncbi:hypothetical protein PDPE_1-00991 [Photobacterium damselae subsp. piscicida]|uniref:Uncharacterized protein n=1 Tax=Photobacterium damsela subsp. piscicida TaxID=38294 RepID=A0AAD1CHJ1_PHODP|nr:hypothetical protein [Photobacterium damselae]BAX54400.1 hypothetical protein PDPUS_1_03026 [Photobacterium damselae subsp. piscicida]BBC40151.1 hypothetical protein PDPE_1-00991 [Photobacterium damselae subsp. piscicida]GAW43705.1 hypothetical protein PDPJ_1_01119 [Photobacterium damselae subsp. piscicida]
MKQSIVWVLMLGLMGCRANDDSLTQFIQDVHKTARAKWNHFLKSMILLQMTL